MVRSLVLTLRPRDTRSSDSPGIVSANPAYRVDHTVMGMAGFTSAPVAFDLRITYVCVSPLLAACHCHHALRWNRPWHGEGPDPG